MGQEAPKAKGAADILIDPRNPVMGCGAVPFCSGRRERREKAVPFCSRGANPPLGNPRNRERKRERVVFHGEKIRRELKERPVGKQGDVSKILMLGQ